MAENLPKSVLLHEIIEDINTELLAKADISDLMDEAPIDGNQYARQDGAWAIVQGMRGNALFVMATDPTLTEDVETNDIWIQIP